MATSVSRRELLTASIQVLGATAGGAGAVAMLAHRSSADAADTRFVVGPPDSLRDGDAKLALAAGRRVWVVRQGGEVFALLGTCTHLGCNLRWLPFEDQFKCPCHGSGFRRTGEVTLGPALRSMERLKIALVAGQLQVDSATRFRQERGEWSHPDSRVVLGGPR